MATTFVSSTTIKKYDKGLTQTAWILMAQNLKNFPEKRKERLPSLIKIRFFFLFSLFFSLPRFHIPSTYLQLFFFFPFSPHPAPSPFSLALRHFCSRHIHQALHPLFFCKFVSDLTRHLSYIYLSRRHFCSTSYITTRRHSRYTSLSKYSTCTFVKSAILATTF